MLINRLWVEFTRLLPEYRVSALEIHGKWNNVEDDHPMHDWPELGLVSDFHAHVSTRADSCPALTAAAKGSEGAAAAGGCALWRVRSRKHRARDATPVRLCPHSQQPLP